MTVILVFVAVLMVAKFAGYLSIAMIAMKTCTPAGAEADEHKKSVRKFRTILGSSSVAGAVVVAAALMTYLFVRDQAQGKIIQAVAASVVLGSFVCVIAYNAGVSIEFFAKTGKAKPDLSICDDKEARQKQRAYSDETLCKSGCASMFMKRQEWIVIASSVGVAVLAAVGALVWIKKNPSNP